MEEKIIVLSCGKPWYIKDENGVVTMEGCTIWYYPTGNLSKVEQEDGTIGCQPVKQSMGVGFYDEVKKVGLPAVATVQYGMKTSGGKMTLYIKGLEFEQSSKK